MDTKPNRPEKTCPVCEAKFIARRPWATYCSAKCRKTAWIITKRVGGYSDIREQLARIESKLDLLLGSRSSEKERP
jgi:hypothetical protein